MPVLTPYSTPHSAPYVPVTIQDPNSDFIEIFDALESIPAAPKKLLDGFLSWAKGDQVGNIMIVGGNEPTSKLR